MLTTHLSQGHDFEVAYTLLILSILSIKLPGISKLGPFDDRSSICRCILGLMSENGLLDGPLEECATVGPFVEQDLSNRNWLFVYEATKRGWIKTSAESNIVKKSVFFEKLLAAGVSFLDDAIFKSSVVSERKTPKAAPAVKFATALKSIRRSWSSYDD